ncbi:hypothetical protein Aperf_G00000028900 [Anoplocephala perfoliata]
MYNDMKIEGLVLSLLLLVKTAHAVRGCTVIAIQPDLLWKKAVCDTDTSLLTKLPSDLPNTLISLRVTQQLIRRLDDGELRRLVYLEEFYLDSCQLEQVDINVFEGLNRLRILSLRNNSIRLDESGFLPTAFYHLPALEVLDLSENPLGRVPPNFFPTSLGKSLFELRLSHIKGELPLRLEASTFIGLRNLQVLDLSFCHLETLSSDFRSVFQRMEKLRELQLGGNPWHCDCNLRWLREWYLSDTLPSMQLSYDQKTKFGTTNAVTPTCKSPYVVKRRQIFIPSGRGAIEPEEFVCKQWIDSTQKHITAVLGSNLSLTCQGYFESMKTVQWFKDHLPLITPSSNYIISQSNSLDFTAQLNITNVRYEDAGIWECGLDDGSAIQKAAINVTLKLMTAAETVSRMDAQRQNLVYAGIGIAVVFILLTAIALTVFCCWGRRGTEKTLVFTSCANRLQRNSTYGVSMSNMGKDTRELIGTRVAGNRPDSPVPIKNVSSYESKPKGYDVTSNHIASTDHAPASGMAKKVISSSSSPKLISLTTATTTTTVLTQPASATVYKQPTSPHSTVLLAAEFSSPSNTPSTANCADLYHLPISGGYGAASLPSHLFAQLAVSTNGSTAPSANNPFLISAPCPIHGINSKLQDSPEERPQEQQQHLAMRNSIFDACPIHGSPASIASKNASKRMASSFTQTPLHATKSKSATSLRATKNRSDRSSYHSRPKNNARKESFGSHQSSSSTQFQYRTLPPRISAKMVNSCPIHGQFVSSLLKRQSSSTSFEQRNQLISRSRRAQSITMDVPYCSSCASSSSSEDTAPAEARFEDYSSDFSESPVAECSDSGSSDYIVNSQSNLPIASLMMPMNRNRYNANQKYGDSSSSSSRDEEVGGTLTDKNSLFLIPEDPINQRRNRPSSTTTRTILGEPLVLTSMDRAGANNALLTRSLQRSRESLNKQARNTQSSQMKTSNHAYHSRETEAIPSSSSSNQMAPKSILVKNSSHRNHWRRSSEFDDRSTDPL